MRKVTVIVPCYNEGSRLQIEEFCAYLKSNETNFVFVNDGSSDNTAEVLGRLQQVRPDLVSVLNETVNRGKSEAVRRGICFALECGCDYVGFWDADLATPLQEIPFFVQLLQENSQLEMVFGARVKLLGRHVERKAVRHYLGRLFATFVSQMLDLPIYDTQCGAKLFRVTTSSQALFGRPFLSRWVFDVEIIARYLAEVGQKTAANRIYEFPLHSWVDVTGSKLKARDFFIAFWDVLRIRQTYLT